MSNKRHLVMVVSNQQDLVEERIIVQEALAAMDCIATGFAFPGQTDPYLWKLSQKALQDADYCLFLQGNQYGALSQTGVGFAHQAFAHAKAINKPIYSLIYRGNDKKSLNPQDDMRLKQLHVELEKEASGYWSNEDELRDQVERGMEQLLEFFPSKGWLPAGTGGNQENERVESLQRQIQLLKRSLDQTRMHGAASFDKQDVEVFVEYQCKAFKDGQVHKVSGSARYTIKDYFIALAPTFLKGANAKQLRAGLSDFLQVQEMDFVQTKIPKAHAIVEMNIDIHQFEYLLLKLRSLGLVQISKQQWGLSPLGDNFAMNWIAE